MGRGRGSMSQLRGVVVWPCWCAEAGSGGLTGWAQSEVSAVDWFTVKEILAGAAVSGRPMVSTNSWVSSWDFVGEGGFEPPTSCTQIGPEAVRLVSARAD